MRGLVNFLKATIAGGFFVVLPVAFVVFLLGQTIDALVGLVAPIAEDLPFREVGGVGVATLLSALIVLAFCFITGLLISTRVGEFGRNWIERKLLNRLPGYTIIKNLTRRFSGIEGTEFAPALVDLYGASTRSLAFIVEEHENGSYAVFVPLAPTPTIGQVHLVPHEKVSRIQAPLGAVLNSIMQWGVESRELFTSRYDLNATRQGEPK